MQMGHRHRTVAATYRNIGALYEMKQEYDTALEYHERDLQVHPEKSTPKVVFHEA